MFSAPHPQAIQIIAADLDIPEVTQLAAGRIKKESSFWFGGYPPKMAIHLDRDVNGDLAIWQQRTVRLSPACFDQHMRRAAEQRRRLAGFENLRAHKRAVDE